MHMRSKEKYTVLGDRPSLPTRSRGNQAQSPQVRWRPKFRLKPRTAHVWLINRMWKQGFQSGATECSGNPVRILGTIHPQPRIQGHPGGSRRRRPHRPLYTESRWAPAAAWAAGSELHAHRPLAASAPVPATLGNRRRPRRLGPPGIGYRHTAGRWCDTFSCPKP